MAAALGPQLACTMFREALIAVPDAGAEWFLDCGDEPGLALAALRAGVPEVRVDLWGDARARVAEIARQHGANVADVAEGAPILDLADIEDPLTACREWLKSR